MKINGNELYAYIVSGARNVIVNEQNLNRLNVFPVPDGDTGNKFSTYDEFDFTRRSKNR